MKRKLAEDWTRFLDGGDEAPSTDVPSPKLQALLQADLATHALLRARGRVLSKDDGDAFTASVTTKLNKLVAAEQFTQGVSHRLRRQRTIRALGIAAVCVAFSAAGAWYALDHRGPGQPDTGALSTEALLPSPRHAPLPQTSKLPLSQAAPSAIGAPDVVFVVGADPPDLGDEVLRQHLERLGLRTFVKIPSQLTRAEASAAKLLAISSTVESAAFEGERAGWLAALAVPIVVWEPWLFDDLGLADCERNRGCGRAVASAELTLVAGGTPLINSPTKVVTVARSPIVTSFGVPLVGAIKVATAETDETRSVIFVYERGSALRGGPAPARRVALFLADDTARFLTDEGWALFDGAIRWAMGGANSEKSSGK